MSEGVTTDFLLDGSEIAEEIAGEGVTSYVGPGLISEVSGTTRSVYHADGLGSTRAMSGNSQVITEAGIYDAYGNLAQDFPASSSPSFGYAGQHRYCTDATGLDYLKARYYDPAVGRFLSRDPVGYEEGLNLYGYARQNPLFFIDPEGASARSICLEGCKKVYEDAKDRANEAYHYAIALGYAACAITCAVATIGYGPCMAACCAGGYRRCELR